MACPIPDCGPSGATTTTSPISRTTSINARIPGAEIPSSFDTNINGGYRAIVPIGVFDEVNPFDIDSTLFLKSLAIGDLVALRELGIFDLAEEDMGIFSYVCPSKYDYVALFNDCMEMIWKEETS